MTKVPMLKADLNMIDENRSKAISLFEEAWGLIKQAQTCVEVASMGDRYDILEWRNYYDLLIRKSSNNKFDKGALTKAIDEKIWSNLLIKSPLWALLDDEGKDAFRRDMEKSPIEANKENIISTLRNLQENADLYFERGVVNIFRRLSGIYKSHDPFEIKKKVIIKIFYGPYRFSTDNTSQLVDLDRVAHVLNGKVFSSDYSYGLVGAVREAKKTFGTFETDYFSGKVCKNGNAHIEIKQPELVKQINRIIAHFCGAVIPSKKPV